jgi:benzoyl-CoA reductase/2-hydroxyglutaryl-CoA dehydratase subunit BcrC/BadD/HgdB
VGGTTALQELSRVAADRHAPARRWKASGGTVLGYVGADVPVELITATGALAVRLAGRPGTDTAAGDRYLGRGLDQVARSILTQLVEGELGHLDALVVSRDTEASLRLFYALRELHRVEPETALPPVHLVDLLHLPHRTTARYDLAKVRQLAGVLERWTGRAITEAALADAVALHEQARALLTRVADLRRESPARLSGSQAHAVVAAGTALPCSVHVELLHRLLDEAGDLSPVEGVRTFLTGSSHDSPGVYAQLERAGLIVVGEDSDWGDLSFERRVEVPTLLGLAERYQYDGPTAQRASIRARAAYTEAAATRCGAELLVSYARVHDDAPLWDVPAQRTAVAAHGLRTVVLEQQPYGAVAEADLERALAGVVPVRSAAR